MKLEHAIRLLAGTLILFSLAMYYFVSPWWLLLTTFVGLNLVQSAFTKWCLAEEIFKKLFYSKSVAQGTSAQAASVKR
jgi:hypothetical protein